MKRYETDLRDGVLYLEAPGDGDTDLDDGDWLEIGAMDDVVDLIGDEEYVLEYDDRQQAVGWLDTDADGTLSFDVRETILEMDHNEDFAEAIAGTPADETTEEGHPKRARTFADLMTTIWDAKGDL